VGPKTNRQGNMSCFSGGPMPILVGPKSCVLKHEP